MLGMKNIFYRKHIHKPFDIAGFLQLKQICGCFNFCKGIYLFSVLKAIQGPDFN